MDEKNLKKINEMNNEELNNALYDKMRAEQDKFRAWLESQTVSEILHHTYEYVTKEDILMALDDNPLPTAQARALLQSSSPLEDIYKDWTKKETDYMQDILDTIAERANIFLQQEQEEFMQFANVPLYNQTYECAADCGDIDLFRKSHQANVACGQAIEEAVKDITSGMTAVLGLEREKLQAICEQCESMGLGVVSIANYNCPGQIVITGEADAVNRAGEALKEKGAKRIIPLQVSGPFHSQMLRGAGERLRKDLEKIRLSDFTIPYVANLTAEYVYSTEHIRESLEKQVSSPVRWQQSVERMLADGVDTFVEIGPGKTLSGFVKKMSREVTVLNVDQYEDLAKCVEVLANA